MKSIPYGIILLLFTYISTTPTWGEREISEVWEDMVNNVEQNKLRRYMVFVINKENVSDPEFFSRVVSDFFLSNNFQNGVINIKNTLFIVYLSKKDNIKIKTVREYFGNAFTKIYWFDKQNKEHDFRKNI